MTLRTVNAGREWGELTSSRLGPKALCSVCTPPVVRVGNDWAVQLHWTGFPPSLDHLPLFLLLFIFLCLLSSSSFLLLSSCLYLFLCLYYSRLPQFILNGMHSCNIYFLILTNVCNTVSNPLTKGIKTEYFYTSQELFLSLSGQSPSPRQHLLWILPT